MEGWEEYRIGVRTGVEGGGYGEWGVGWLGVWTAPV